MTTHPTETLTDELREKTRAAIRASGIKQIWIADRLGISEKHLSQMLTGRVTLTLDWAQRIAALCGHKVTVAVEPVSDADRERQRAEEAEAALQRVLAVAEVIDANGIGWAADSVRRAAEAPE
ncbi:helix-turn-helix transcriptional regulator [Streptomyces scabiei]|uniref:helix-turn-helix transcriptional regulator n=1 Tax=Streptomyces scabiei TaxID=1930 RepID=UPI0029A90810|nr:helix-turn-helix transcriptional regulator [Streptomyces scabiei]MDX3520748.1 helix-turn-helix transcriptional regulator [Streptomyces scabiei]